MSVRPTSLGLALLNAAMRHVDESSNPLAQRVGSAIIKNDRPSQPLKSGYNRTMCDNLRVSAKTLKQCF